MEIWPFQVDTKIPIFDSTQKTFFTNRKSLLLRGIILINHMTYSSPVIGPALLIVKPTCLFTLLPCSYNMASS